MPFKVTARTILQLGAELISSDAVAFYELIKNAFDAGSRRVEISVIVRLQDNSSEMLRDLIEEAKEEGGDDWAWEITGIPRFKRSILSEVDSSAPDALAFKNQVSGANTSEELLGLIDEANYIEIADWGEGMTFNDLKEIYLTIGTRSRLEQKEQQKKLKGRKNASSERPILGEKGLGRLSAMRLGRRLIVKTSEANEARWNILEIDWTRFSHASDEMLEEIEISPRRGEKKDDSQASGTTLRISGLESPWSLTKLEDIAKHEFSRLTDPFVPKKRYPITLKYNGEIVKILPFDKFVFQHAHAHVTAELSFDGPRNPRLTGKVDYRHRQKTIDLQRTRLTSITGMPLSTIHDLGPFRMELYWFNRRLLTEAAGVPDAPRVRELVTQWAGGLMLYRNGFRVNPYGSPEDDWLDLDRRALASQGYKVNRRQIIGKVDITSDDNPSLVDQTNREGLRDNEEKRALVRLLQHILMTEFKTFMNSVDEEVQAKEPLSFEDFETRVEAEERQIERSIQLLIKRYPKVAQDTEVISSIRGAADRIRQLMDQANQLAEEYEKGHTQMLHLAGLGLMVEILGHELSRATTHTITTLEDSRKTILPPDVASLFDTLKEQLRTLEKRLRVLDPLSTSGRQIKETFDLISWVEDILKSHRAQFERHHIKWNLDVESNRPTAIWEIKAVKGMVVQILENLISNSVYWLKQEKTLNRSFKPEINITIDTGAKEIRFTDNGPGIEPERAEEIFQPFVTSKPPGEGKGLGLYISREIAKYNGATLHLSEERTIHPDSLNTFVLALE